MVDSSISSAISLNVQHNATQSQLVWSFKSQSWVKVKVVKLCWKKWNEYNLMYIYHKQCEILQKIHWNSSNVQFQWFPIDSLWKWSKRDQNYANANASRCIAKFFSNKNHHIFRKPWTSAFRWHTLEIFFSNLSKMRLRLHSSGPFWTISTENQWDITEIECLSCFGDFFL